MKAQAVGYWICTVLIGLSFLSGGAAELWRVPQVVEGMTHLGYPAASASHIAVGDDVRHIVTPLVLAGLVVASWALRPEGRQLKRA